MTKKQESAKKGAKHPNNKALFSKDAIPELTDQQLIDTVKTYLANGQNISATARDFDLTRVTVRKRLEKAQDRGLLPEDAVLHMANPTRHRPFDKIVKDRKDEFQRVEAAGTYQSKQPIPLPDDKPFCLVALGDPHLDNPGTDLDLWEHWISTLSEDCVRSVCLGDVTDNWLRFLGHLYGKAESTDADSFTLLEGYMDQIGSNMDIMIGGNHDLWNNEYGLELLCRFYDVNYRAHGATLAYTTPEGRAVTVGMRHRFTGHSQWNTVHAITKAAMMGWRENILIGGDKHISGHNRVKDPMTGKVTTCIQLAAFKLCDDYAEEKGFQDQHITPAVALVIDPSRSDDDPRLVKSFDCPVEGLEYTQFLRSKA